MQSESPASHFLRTCVRASNTGHFQLLRTFLHLSEEVTKSHMTEDHFYLSEEVTKSHFRIKIIMPFGHPRS